MIISNSNKFIFIHIPKCGGTSVSDFFERRLLPQDISLNLSPHLGWDRYLEAVGKKYGLNKHSTAREIKIAVTPRHFADYFVFTFCRNPFARAYSVFTFTNRADAKHRPDSQRYRDIKHMSFEDFLSSPYMQDYKIFQSRPQNLWVQGGPANMGVFKLEEIDDSLRELSIRFYGVEHPKSASRLNFSADRNAWKSMSGQAVDRIRTLYSEDFDRFGYSRTIEH